MALRIRSKFLISALRLLLQDMMNLVMKLSAIPCFGIALGDYVVSKADKYLFLIDHSLAV